MFGKAIDAALAAICTRISDRISEAVVCGLARGFARAAELAEAPAPLPELEQHDDPADTNGRTRKPAKR